MKNETVLALIEMSVPDWVTQEIFEQASEILLQDLKDLEGIANSNLAKRGYLLGAQQEGFEVDPVSVKDEDLTELVIRAFWFAFEKHVNGHRLVTAEAVN